MSEPQFIGILLVRNEDRFLRRAVGNVLDFCDRIFIADHQSTDGTFELAQELARESAKIEPHRIRDPRESSEMLEPFANTQTWVLGVDGDEIYDPAGLAFTRAQLVAGAWSDSWIVFGNVVNCIEIDERAKTARGWLAPPCRSMTKLYNFAAVQSLDPDSPQRLMGLNNVFNPGFDASQRLEVHKAIAWDDAQFRCLHACFLPRSTADSAQSAARENITELRKFSPTSWLSRTFSKAAGREAASVWKQDKYTRGELVTVDASPFFP